MKSVIIHGLLLFCVLVFGYRILTAEKKPQGAIDTVEVWGGTASSVRKLVYESEARRIVIERRGSGSGAYYWGAETKKNGTNSPTGATLREFPLGRVGEETVALWAPLRVLRKLPVPGDVAKLVDFGFTDKVVTLTLTIEGIEKQVTVGGRVAGGGERYLRYGDSILIVAATQLTSLESGEASLRLQDPKNIDFAKVASLSIEAGGKTLTYSRKESVDSRGNAIKTWADASGSPDANATNVIDAFAAVRPLLYEPEAKPSEMQRIATVRYSDAAGAHLATLELFARDNSGAAANTASATAPSPFGKEYFVATEATHGVLGRIAPSAGDRIETDVRSLVTKAP